MRVAFVITRADAIGGAQVHVRDLALALMNNGHEVLVLAGGNGPYVDQLRSVGISCRPLRHLVHPIRPVRDLLAIRELTAALREFRPHLVSTHSSKAGMIGRLAGRRLGVPVLFTAHGWAFTDGVGPIKRRIYTMAERRAARWGERIITVSDYDRELAIRRGVAPAEKLVAIHNGMPDVDPALQADPGIDPPRIVMVARYEVQKDHATLLQSLSRLQHLPWELHLIGDGPLQDRTQVMASQVGLAERITFCGARDDVAQRLAEAQIYALISNWEGLPRSIIEAMRAGLPIVASDVGGTREEVVDEQTGFLVTRGDSMLLRDRLGRLLTSPRLRAQMGRAARERYERHFTFNRMLANTVDVYLSMLAPSLDEAAAAPLGTGLGMQSADGLRVSMDVAEVSQRFSPQQVAAPTSKRRWLGRTFSRAR